MREVRVLMVCLGNICRSPMAQGALEKAARAEGLAVAVDSAGVAGWHAGAPPDPRAVAAAAARGCAIAAQRARAVRPQDFHGFDLLLAMDAAVLEDLRRQRPPDAQAALGLLLDHAPDPCREGEGRDVPDPYYEGAEAFERALDLIERGVAGLIPHLRAMATPESGPRPGA